MKIKTYQKDFDYTYTLGVFETIELLKYKPQQVIRVYLKSNSYTNQGVSLIQELCQRHQIEVVESDKTINKLSKKDNCFAIAILNKYDSKLNDGNHIVLVNPMNMGNFGTIIRSALGFGFTDIAVIKPAIDIFDPKVLRAAMGSFFSSNIVYFNTIEEYKALYPDHKLHSFMLQAKKTLQETEFESTPLSLVFGNESSGLPENYLDDNSIIIKHSNDIDSLNLPTAVGIALYEVDKQLKKR